MISADETMWVKHPRVRPETLPVEIGRYYRKWATPDPLRRRNTVITGPNAELFLRAAVSEYHDIDDEMTVMFTSHRRLWAVWKEVNFNALRDEDSPPLLLDHEVGFLQRFELLCIEYLGSSTDEAFQNIFWDVIVPRTDVSKCVTLVSLVHGMSVPLYATTYFDASDGWDQVVVSGAR